MVTLRPLTPEEFLAYEEQHEPLVLSYGDTLEGDDVLPGFTLALADIFRD